MKKTLLSFAMLLIGMGAMAQTTIELTTDPSSPITYVMESNRPAYANPHLHYHDGKIRFYQPNVYGTKDMYQANGTVEDYNFLFYFTKASEGTFYIHPYVAEPNMVYGVETVGVNSQIVLVDKNNPDGKTPIEWTLANGGSSLKYLKTTIDGVDYCMNDGNSRPSYCLLHEVSGTPGNGYVIKFLPKTAPKCTITDSKYATFYAAHTVTIPEGVSAYYVSNVNENSASLTEIEGAIPANTGVILYSETAKEYDFKVAAFGAADAVETNLLAGTIETTEVEGRAYILAHPEGDLPVGLYLTEERQENKFQNKANKAYLPATAVTSAARFIGFDFGTETAIDELKGESGNVKTVVFDLSGRRVQKAQKGIFIVNGKKVVK